MLGGPPGVGGRQDVEHGLLGGSGIRRARHGLRRRGSGGLFRGGGGRCLLDGGRDGRNRGLVRSDGGGFRSGSRLGLRRGGGSERVLVLGGDSHHLDGGGSIGRGWSGAGGGWGRCGGAALAAGQPGAAAGAKTAKFGSGRRGAGCLGRSGHRRGAGLGAGRVLFRHDFSYVVGWPALTKRGSCGQAAEGGARVGTRRRPQAGNVGVKPLWRNTFFPGRPERGQGGPRRTLRF